MTAIDNCLKGKKPYIIIKTFQIKQFLALPYYPTINTLLGSPRKLFCQCCGMPLEDDRNISRETDKSFNEDYCKWCYTDGNFVYKNMDELLAFLIDHMSNENFTPEQARAYFSQQLPKLKHWNSSNPSSHE